MIASSNLHNSKKNKEDEFYTELSMIENELKHYKNHFKEKTIFCNCDDPYESNFFKYFAINFNSLGLKKLIATCYVTSPVMFTQLSLFDEPKEEDTDEEKKPYKIEITEVKDENGDGSIGLADVEYLIKNNKNVLSLLEGNDEYGAGDFRSDECIALLKEADIVVTNPPFSLFREYMGMLLQYKKKFLIIGRASAISYKELFPYFLKNKIWMGVNSGHFWFKVPESYEEKRTDFKIDENGQKWRRMGNISWFTNLDYIERYDDMPLYKKYSPELYPTYDNYDAIEVSETKNIPCDYDGIMGVPVTFMNKFNPNQFEILGCTQRDCHNEVPDTKKYNEYREMKQNGKETGSSGVKTNENPVIVGNDGIHNYYVNSEGRIVQSLSTRIFIRRKAHED